MKKVALLGDSIRQIGYGKKVAEQLGEDYQVWQPNDNCRFALYTLRMLFDYSGDLQGSDIIHWNNGLWDVCDIIGDHAPFVPIEEYVGTMVRIAKKLKTYAPRVIFATTTPVRDDNPYNDNDLIIKFNEALVPKLKELGVEINDLHAAVYPRRNELIRADDRIHLTDEAIDVCAELVIKAIKKN